MAERALLKYTVPEKLQEGRVKRVGSSCAHAPHRYVTLHIPACCKYQRGCGRLAHTQTHDQAQTQAQARPRFPLETERLVSLRCVRTLLGALTHFSDYCNTGIGVGWVAR